MDVELEPVSPYAQAQTLDPLIREQRARENHNLQGYLMQTELLEQQTERRLARLEKDEMEVQSKERSLERQEIDNPFPVPHSFQIIDRHLQDFQAQMMLMEQQNKMRLLYVKQEKENAQHEEQRQRNQAREDYEAQLKILESGCRKRWLEMNQGRENKQKRRKSNSGVSASTVDAAGRDSADPGLPLRTRQGSHGSESTSRGTTPGARDVDSSH